MPGKRRVYHSVQRTTINGVRPRRNLLLGVFSEDNKNQTDKTSEQGGLLSFSYVYTCIYKA